MSPKFAFNNVIDGFIKKSENQIMVQNYHAPALVRHQDQYILPQYYRLFKHNDRWNIIHEPQQNNGKGINKQLIDLCIRYKQFIDQLDRETS
jgi:hypothetical protein